MEEGRFGLRYKHASQIMAKDQRHQNHLKNVAFQKDLEFMRTGSRSAGFTASATCVILRPTLLAMTKFINLVSFLVTVIKCSGKSGLMEKGFILPLSSRCSP